MEEKNILILEWNGKIALLKRPAKGLLAKLWSFPDLPGDFKSALEQLGFRVLSVEEKPSAKHIFTHIEWRMRIFSVRLGAPPPENDYVWVSPEELKKDYAVPAAYQGALNAIGITH